MPSNDNSLANSYASPIAIAFCTDKIMEAALHVAARSMLANLDPQYRPHIYAMLEGFSAADRALLERTLALTGRDFELTYLDAAPEVFAGLQDLHGSLSTYYRLSLPEMVPYDRLLYLDSDILVQCDVSPLFAVDMGQSPLGAIVDGRLGDALDRDLRLSLGQALDDPAFNAGILLFNCTVWRERNLLQECLSFARHHGAKVPNRDQSILNSLFASVCIHLPVHFNAKIYSHAKQVPTEGLLHYVGSPKPWDLGARLILPYAKAWFAELAKTALPFSRRSPWLTAQSWRRFPKILGGYKRFVERKLRP